MLMGKRFYEHCNGFHKSSLNSIKTFKFDALRDLVPFVQFRKRENTHRGVLRLVKLRALARNFTKSITPPWVFFHVY